MTKEHFYSGAVAVATAGIVGYTRLAAAESADLSEKDKNYKTPMLVKAGALSVPAAGLTGLYLVSGRAGSDKVWIGRGLLAGAVASVVLNALLSNEALAAQLVGTTARWIVLLIIIAAVIYLINKFYN